MASFVDLDQAECKYDIFVLLLRVIFLFVRCAMHLK